MSHESTSAILRHWRLCILVPVVLCVAGLALAHQPGWTKYEGNPVLVPGEPGEWDDEWLDVPSVLHDGSTFHMWYSGCPVGGPTLVAWCGVGYATSPDGMVWTKHPDNPVLTAGVEGSWDDNATYAASVIFDGQTYTMWYVGEQAFLGTSEPTEVGIGMATSTDGVSWTKLPGNPVLTEGDAGSWDEEIGYSLSVVFDGETYRMWYDVIEAATASIGYATSTDGITWIKHPDNPVLEAGDAGAWDASGVNGLEVFFDGVTYHGLYAGASEGTFGQSIGYASSPDGAAWTKGGGHGGPVLRGGRLESDWDYGFVGWPGVVVHNEQAWMYFWGLTQGLGLATASMDNLFDPPDCLNDNRFRVSVWWWDADGNVGDGVPVKLTDDSGYLWFFDQDNVELVVKVLDGCAVNGHYWVFAAGLTNVGATITVTDTQTMEQVTYMNTLGEAFQPIQDTAAFAACD